MVSAADQFQRGDNGDDSSADGARMMYEMA